MRTTFHSPLPPHPGHLGERGGPSNPVVGIGPVKGIGPDGAPLGPARGQEGADGPGPITVPAPLREGLAEFADTSAPAATAALAPAAQGAVPEQTDLLLTLLRHWGERNKKTKK